MFIRTPYNYDMSAESKRTGLACDPESGKTQQQFKEECDINTLVERFGLTGKMPDVVATPMSGDFTGVYDFKSALLAVREAQENFDALPAALRYRFANDPQRLMDFMADGGNYEEALKLGLVNKRAEVTREEAKP